MKKEQIFLILASAGLFPIALSYGVSPEVSLDFLYNVDVNTLELTHIFRAVMGLYIAMASFWLLGAFNSKFKVHALYSLVVFMSGLAAGRVLSIIVDGSPGPLLWMYTALEIGFAFTGLKLLTSEKPVASKVEISNVQEQS